MEDGHVLGTAGRMSVETVAPGAETAANSEAVRRMAAAQPVFVDIRLAREVMPDMQGQVVLHAGPPIAYERMCPLMRSAVQAAMVYEGWAPDRAAADKLLAAGQIELAPCHSRQAVGTMTGIISPSTPVFVVRNDSEPHNAAFGRVTEGFGKGLRFGGGEISEAVERLRWVRDKLAPALQAALRVLPEQRLPLRPLMAQASGYRVRHPRGF